MRGEPTASPGLERWSRAMIRHGWLVAGVWAVVVVASTVAALGLGDLLSNRYSIPGSGSHRVNEVLGTHYGQLTDGVFQVAASGPTDSAASAAAARAAADAASQLPKSHVAGVVAVRHHVAVAVVTTTLEQADSKLHVADMRRAIATHRQPGVEVAVGGPGAIAADLGPILEQDLRRGELEVALPIALIILAVVFGTMGCAIPFLFALITIPTSLGGVWLFAHVMDLSSFIQNMVVGVGLGISIDYSLIMYWRYREERLDDAGELDNSPAAREQAVVRTMLTAGRAVVFSGVAVAIGLSVLLLMPLPFMRGFGVAGLVIPVVSIAAAMTLMPVVLYALGHRLERVRFVSRERMRRRDLADQSGWARFAGWIMRRPWPVFLISSAALLVLAAPATGLQVLPGSNAGVPASLESIRAEALLARAVGTGGGTPAIVIVDRNDAAARTGLQRLASDAARDHEVRRVAPVQPSRTGHYLRLDIYGRHDYGDGASSDLVRRLRDHYVPSAHVPGRVSVGGAPAIGVDLIHSTYATFPWLVAGVLALTYVLLLRAFRSLLLPLKAIILNLLSISAAFGLLHVVFATSLAPRLGLTHASRIEFWIPVFLFAMLFGLSMDYEVFLVSRMREGWDETHDNEAAVKLGLARTGRLVTAAGVIMVAAFGGFLRSRPVGFQQFGLGLTSAVLIDVTLVRALLLPSAMKLFGRWNWWLPAGIARIVRVQPSPIDHLTERRS